MESKTNEELIEDLQRRLDIMAKSLYGYGENIAKFRSDLHDLKQKVELAPAGMEPSAKTEMVEEPAELAPSAKIEIIQPPAKVAVAEPPRKEPAAVERDREKFWGQNVIGKIGICIAVVGVVALLKYLFDRDVLSTAVKVGFGYLASAVSVFFAARFEKSRRILSSILFIGGVLLSYLLTFLSYSYFNLFGQATSLTLSGGIALMAAAVGYWKGMPLFNVASFLIFFVPVGSGISMGQGNSLGWNLFAIALLLAVSAVGVLRRKFWTVVTALLILMLSTSMFKAVGSFLDSYFVVVGFSLVHVAFNIVRVRKPEIKADNLVLSMVWNAIWAFSLMVVISDNFDKVQDFVIGCLVLAAVAGSQVLAFVRFFADKLLLRCNLGIFIWLFNIALSVHFYNTSHLFYLGLVMMAEAGLLLLWRIKSGMEFLEKMSFAALAVSALAMFDVSTYYFNQEVPMVFNAGFLSMMLYSVGCYLLSCYYSVRKFDASAYVAAFAVLLAGIMLEVTECVSHISVHWVGLCNIAAILLYFTVMTLLSRYSRYEKQMRETSLSALLVSQALMCLPGLIYMDNITGTGNFWPEVLSLAIMALSVVVAFGSKKSKGDRTKEVLQYFYIMTIVWMELVLKFDDSDALQLWISLLMAMYAGVLFFIGFKFKKKEVRWYGIILAILIALKIVVYDLWNYSLGVKSVVFILVGGIFLLISWLYSKYLKDKE